MYNFIDVNETSEGTFLPSEALKINGEYIENLIPGYRTLNVSGREALSPEVYTFETGNRDGSGLTNKRYPERVINVTYQLIAANNSAFRDAYNKLGGILNVVDAELIFNDEPDKFFIGTPSNIGEVDPGKNSVVGQFDILCLDPFKYSVTEYESTPTAGSKSVTIEYNGTFKSYPTLQVNFAEESEPDDITGKGECGYVAFFDANKHILQFGDPEEVDGISGGNPESQTLINQRFKYSNSWTSGAQALWTFKGAPFDYQQIGTLGMKLLPNSNYYFLTPTSYGTYANGGHGASMMRTIPADASGDTTNKNFDLYFKPVFEIASGGDGIQSYGEWALILLSSDNEKVAKIRIVKNTSGKTASLMFYVGEKTVYSGTVDVSAGNAQFGKGAGNPNCKISRTVGGIEFAMGGVRKSFRETKSSSIPSISKIAFMFSQYYSNRPVAYNGIMSVEFDKNYCETYKDIPNKFKSNDVLEVDCKSGTVLVNNAKKPELGALGNDWEDFHLSPGLNQIGFSYSDWVDSDNTKEAPTVKIRYREAYL